MPWDDIARKQHSREAMRYPSDLTDCQGDSEKGAFHFIC